MARRVPSGLKATPVTASVWPVQGAQLPPRRDVPHLGRLIPTGRGQARAIGAEGHASDRIGVAVQGEQLPPGRDVPHLGRLIHTGRGQARAIGAEGHASDRIGVAGQGELHSQGLDSTM